MRSAGHAVMAAPFGAVLLREDSGVLVGVDLLPSREPSVAAGSFMLREAVLQFQAYFDEPHWQFSLPLASGGTPFQQRVWQALTGIPVSSVASYGALARQLSSSPRAVAGACRTNRIPLIVPCHRVVSSLGIGGYCGHVHGPYLDIKRWLLRHEGHGGF